ncbi:unnamed protein product [Adineta steineri]|uniref:Uncharacterized protein n=1 Tax=Adineta steineri TaxID=433720 RepID=A0A815D7H3_9BILA|nr:unnamed protein product [Adineta steineri]CAF1574437.1 unnamed protein product [Adineta steineri]
MPPMSQNRYCSYFLNYEPSISTLIILICKLIIVTGLIIPIFSSHWARSPIYINHYAGYKNRCSVHVCTSDDLDPTWLVDLACVLGMINLFMEIIYNIINSFTAMNTDTTTIFQEIMFFLTFIVTDCEITFGIHILLYAYALPMGYAYQFFIFSIIFSLIDWGFSLKRFINVWPEEIYLPENEIAYHNNSTTVILAID